MFAKRVLWGIEVFLQRKLVYRSLAVAMKRAVFPFVLKQYIGDKVVANVVMIQQVSTIFFLLNKYSIDI